MSADRRWDQLDLDRARLVADGTPVGIRDQGEAIMRDALDEWGVDIHDPAQLFAFLVGMQVIVDHIAASAQLGRGCSHAEVLAKAARLARTSFVLGYLPAEASR